MNYNNRGYLKVKKSRNNRLNVDIKSVNGNIWLTAPELADLFQVYTSTILGKIKIIESNNVLNLEELTVWHKSKDDSSGNERQVRFFSLNVIVAISYQLNTVNAMAIREFIMRKISRPNLVSYTRLKIDIVDGSHC